jgi:hypothetical protein
MFSEPPTTLSSWRSFFVEGCHNNRERVDSRANAPTICRRKRVLLEALSLIWFVVGTNVLNIRIACITAIVVGLSLEILGIGSAYSVGTIIAGIGIVVFVYDRMSQPPKR